MHRADPLFRIDYLLLVMASDTLPRPAVGFEVKAELCKAPGKGIGVFAAEFIPANTLVYSSEYDSYTEEEATAHLECLPAEEQRDWLEHAFGSHGKVCMDRFDTKMINHSDNPTLNSKTLERVTDAFASRDIQGGEELTEDYRTFSQPRAYTNLCKKYGVIEVYEMDHYTK